MSGEVSPGGGKVPFVNLPSYNRCFRGSYVGGSLPCGIDVPCAPALNPFAGRKVSSPYNVLPHNPSSRNVP